MPPIFTDRFRVCSISEYKYTRFRLFLIRHIQVKTTDNWTPLGGSQKQSYPRARVLGFRVSCLHMEMPGDPLSVRLIVAETADWCGEVNGVGCLWEHVFLWGIEMHEVAPPDQWEQGAGKHLQQTWPCTVEWMPSDDHRHREGSSSASPNLLKSVWTSLLWASSNYSPSTWQRQLRCDPSADYNIR